jgi:chaperonin GroEL (HSP60 family)
MQPASNGQQPVYIMQKGTEQTNGSAAQRNNIQAAKAVGDAIKSTLGPLGMDKMLIDPTGNVIITNDGVSILREIGIEHPAAKMIVEVAKTQESRCFDGTTSAVVLSGSLLGEAERLLDKGIHPTTICKGFRIAKDFCLTELRELAVNNRKEMEDEEGSGKVMVKDISYHAAFSSLTGKSAEGIQHKLALLAQKVVGNVNTIDDVHFISASGTNEEDTHSIPGIVIERDLASQTMSRSNTDAKVLLLDCAVEPKKTSMDAQVQITNPLQVEEFLRQEEDAIRDMVELIHQSGATLVLTQKKIDDLALHYLKKHDISAVHSVKKSDLDSASRISGANIVSSLSNPIDDFDLGKCGFMVTDRFDFDLVMLTNTKDSSPIQTVIACGATSHVAEEVERALEDAVGVAWLMKNDDGILLGGGATQAFLYNSLKKHCRPEGRVQMAVDAFADALLQIPSAIAENAGLDPVDELLDLCKNSADGNYRYFIDVEPEGKAHPHDALKQGIVEPTALHLQALTSATEAAIMVLRIDDVIRMNPSPAGPPMPQM